MELSIIVPVYNVEKYIERCLLSLLNQHLDTESYEIICINDGTKDNSCSIIQKYQQTNKNIRLVNKINGGLSSARNRGIEESKGKYIMFVDSDDYIIPNSLAPLLERMEKENLDFLGYHINIVQNNHTFSYFKHIKFPDNKVINGMEYLSNYYITISSWGHIALKSIYVNNNLRFIDGIINEDYEFMLRLYPLLNRMSFSNNIVYIYDIKDSGSITSTKTTAQYNKSIISWLASLNSLSDWISTKQTLNHNQLNCINKWIDNFKYRASVNLLKSRIPYEKKIEFENVYKSKGIFKFGLQTLSGRRLLIGILIRLQIIRSIFYRLISAK
ncbi:MAG: glycosyltransferase [Duncaniella sp.]|nr:glycosyltransferase [Muribaculum sp.]MCM1254621.1 glycosyltransferase [Duncaniella sp.]